MKKLLAIIAIAASMSAVNAQAQNAKSVAAAKSAVEKAQAATENAKQNNQFSILAEDSLYKEIKAAVLKQIDSYFYGEKGG